MTTAAAEREEAAHTTGRKAGDYQNVMLDLAICVTPHNRKRP
jgi:hypothetical protein